MSAAAARLDTRLPFARAGDYLRTCREGAGLTRADVAAALFSNAMGRDHAVATLAAFEEGRALAGLFDQVTLGGSIPIDWSTYDRLAGRSARP